MMPIIAFWKGTDHDEIRSSGAFAFGNRKDCIPTGSMTVLVVHDAHIEDRVAIDSLHSNLVVFPGPNGKLKQKHIAHIAKEFPKAKAGDAFSTIMDALYAQYKMEVFNSDAY